MLTQQRISQIVNWKIEKKPPELSRDECKLITNALIRSREYGDQCAICRDAIAIESPVYMVKVTDGNGWSVRATCEDCNKDVKDSMRRFACACCGRGVYREREWVWQFPKNTPSYCSSQCRQKHTIQKQKLKRQESRQDIECDSCGKIFTPKRSDSKYCSSKCRQKAYRQRGGK